MQAWLLDVCQTASKAKGNIIDQPVGLKILTDKILSISEVWVYFISGLDIDTTFYGFSG